jgi:hypothetical protein
VEDGPLLPLMVLVEGATIDSSRTKKEPLRSSFLFSFFSFFFDK